MFYPQFRKDYCRYFGSVIGSKSKISRLNHTWIMNRKHCWRNIHGQISVKLPEFSRRDFCEIRSCYAVLKATVLDIWLAELNLYMLWNIYMLNDSWNLMKCNVWLRIYCIRLWLSWIFGTNIYRLKLIYVWVKSLSLCLSYWIAGTLPL
jgi:hypothetical protein